MFNKLQLFHFLLNRASLLKHFILVYFSLFQTEMQTVR